MAKQKMNFTIPQDIVDKLSSQVPKGQRSEFVTSAIEEKLGEIEREALNESLKEGYAVVSKEDEQLNKEWETASTR